MQQKTEIMKIALDYFLQNVEVDTNKKEKK